MSSKTALFGSKRVVRSRRRAAGLTKKQRKEVKTITKRSMETKWFPVFQSLSPSTSGSFVNLTSIGTGDTFDKRDGNRINPFYMSLRCTIEPPNSLLANDHYNEVRVIVFKWREDNGVTAPSVVGDILSTLGSSYVTPVLYPYSFVKRNQYKILYDKTYTLSPTWAFDSSGNPTNQWSRVGPITFRIAKKLAGNIDYTSSSTLSGTGFGNIYLLVVSDSSATPHPVFKFDGFIKYKDD